MVTLDHKTGKIGIVLPGGFMRGAFQVGALKAFYDRRFIPSYIVGSSVGAINGATFAAGRMDELFSMYRDIAVNPHRHFYRWNFYMLLRAFFWSSSILVNTPLRKTLLEHLSFPNLISSPIKVDIITTDFQTGEEVIFSNKNPDHQSTEVLLNALLGSSAVPTIFPAVRYRDHQFFDGSVLEKAPLTRAIKEGCDTIFLLVNDPIEDITSKEQFDTIYSIGKRTMRLISWSGTKRTLKRSHELNQDVNSYKKIQTDIARAIEEHLTDRVMKDTILSSVADIFLKSDISLNRRRSVKIYVLAPPVSEENMSSGVLNSRVIPRFLEEGYRDAIHLIDKLEKNDHDNS